MREEPDLRFRRPSEADYARVAPLIDDWWDGRAAAGLLPRSWFRHFSSTSWLAEVDREPEDPGEAPTIRVAGLLVGYIAPDDPELAVCHAIGVDPNLRRRGVGRALYEHFLEDARSAGARRVEAVGAPDDPACVRFHLALGFRPDDGPGSRRLYGIPAFEAYDFGREDRVRFRRDL
jgi:GNAT superfamily N-acetyltransferase